MWSKGGPCRYRRICGPWWPRPGSAGASDGRAVDAARHPLADIRDGLERLAARPELLRQEPSLSPHLGFFRVREHLVVCDVLAGDLIVLALLQASMDVPRRAAELERLLPDELRWLRQRAGRVREERAPLR